MDLQKALKLVEEVFFGLKATKQEHQVLDAALMTIKQALSDKLEKKE